ncbi:MAG: Glycine reductase, selenoprotein B [Thermovirga lienii]|nr:MAG: Glycine reductase, selenoprotein B [Thermovirga lienii]
MAYRVVHYINQFFAGVGGEEKADYKPEARDGAVGPGMALNAALGGEAEIVGTVICGDSYFADNIEEAKKQILELIAGFKPDALVAGPAFNAGRYGTACGAVCEAVAKELGIPTVTGMYEENPGVDMFRKATYIVKTADSARGMKDAIPVMAKLLLKQLRGEPIGRPEEEGYIPKGVRINYFADKIGAARAVEMFVKKLKGEPYVTEYPMPVFDRVPPNPPITNMAEATVALVTSGGIVPKGNPDHIEASSASKYGEYSLAGMETITSETHETAHGGYDPTYANEDPNRVLPVDVMRELEKEGVIKKFHEVYYSTVGNGTSVANAKKFGAEIAQKLKDANVNAVIVTST